jgi:hypothetical protein
MIYSLAERCSLNTLGRTHRQAARFLSSIKLFHRYLPATLNDYLLSYEVKAGLPCKENVDGLDGSLICLCPQDEDGEGGPETIH